MSAPAPIPSSRSRTRSRLRAAVAVVAGLLAVFVGGAAGAGGADSSFAPSGPLLLAGLNLCAVATADFSGDAKLDLVVADCGPSTVTILLGDGAGGFRPAAGSPIAVGQGTIFVAVGDFSGDGKPDLAVANGDSNDVTVLLGDGAGGFRAAPGSPVEAGGAPIGVAAADLSGDGKVDLVVPAIGNRRNRVTILLGNGSGRFVPSSGSPVAIGGSHLSSFALADFNGDGKADLAVADTESNRTSILLGDGAGGFGPPATVPAGRFPTLLAAADFNGDGKPDLCITNVASDAVTHQVRVLLGDGAGGFRPTAGSPIAVGSVFGAVADLNGDRKPDLAVADRLGVGVAVLLGNGAGGFRRGVDSPFPLPARPFFPRPSPHGIVAADLNGDGKPDLAVTGGLRGGLTVLWQTPSTPLVVPGGALPGRGDAALSTRGSITKLAVDGNRVAVMTKNGCGQVVVWTAPGPRSTSFKTPEGCGDSTIPYHVEELALGGGQVAWIGESGGNYLELDLHLARLSGRAAKQIDYAQNGDGAAEDPSGDWFGQLLGGGPLLAYNRWRVVCNPPPGFSCDWAEPLRLTAQRLVRIVAGRRVVVRRDPDSYPLSAVGGGRMAVESAGAVTLLAPKGSRVATVPAVEGNPPRAIALSKTRLAVARTFTLDLYDPATPTKAKSLPLGPAAALQLVGVNSKLALLRGPRRLVLVRLSDGKLTSLTLRSGTATSLVDASLTQAGLFYAYNTPRQSAKGRIVFEPTAKLLGRF